MPGAPKGKAGGGWGKTANASTFAEASEIDDGAHRTLSAIAALADAAGGYAGGAAKLARARAIDKRTLRRHLAALDKAGLLRTVDGGVTRAGSRLPNRLELMYPEWGEMLRRRLSGNQLVEDTGAPGGTRATRGADATSPPVAPASPPGGVRDLPLVAQTPPLDRKTDLKDLARAREVAAWPPNPAMLAYLESKPRAGLAVDALVQDYERAASHGDPGKSVQAFLRYVDERVAAAKAKKTSAPA